MVYIWHSSDLYMNIYIGVFLQFTQFLIFVRVKRFINIIKPRTSDLFVNLFAFLVLYIHSYRSLKLTFYNFTIWLREKNVKMWVMEGVLW